MKMSLNRYRWRRESIINGLKNVHHTSTRYVEYIEIISKKNIRNKSLGHLRIKNLEEEGLYTAQ